MTPEQLNEEMKAAQLDQFGPDPGVATFPSKFFRYDVFVYQGDPKGNEVASTRTQVRPSYCATEYGAQAIQSIMGGTLSELCPLNPAGLQFGWQTTDNTPYLSFGGQPVNAAFLLDYFTHGYPPSLAMQMCDMEKEGSL